MQMTNKQLIRVSAIVGMLDGCKFVYGREWHGMFDPEVKVQAGNSGMVMIYAVDVESREHKMVATVMQDGHTVLEFDSVSYTDRRRGVA